jgi:hypothetical protein
MGLYDKYFDDGSNYAAYNTAGQPNTILATNQSPMHLYSVGRNEYWQETNNGYQVYDDGVSNPLRQPSQLDRNNGYTPSQYLNNLPEGIEID